MPTTGINVEDADFKPFIVIPSTLLVKPPSKESTLTNIVITKPNTQVILDFKNFDNFPICTFSDRFESIPNIVAINVTGSTIIVIALPINIMLKNIIGCNKLDVATFPVVIIKASNIGTNVFIYPVILVIASLIIFIN